MKRFLSLLLVLCTLLCLFPMAVSAEGEGEGAAESTATYLDLYVKEGLVALFDGYSSVASETAITTWAPVDLYGKAGYDNYLEVADYAFGSNNGGHTWYAKNGSVAPTLNEGADSWSYTYLNLSAIGAEIGVNYTVQQIFDPFAYRNAAQVVPTVENGTVTNAESVKWGMNCDPNFATIGSFIFSGYGVTNQKTNDVNILYGHVDQAAWAIGKNWIHNYGFALPAYGAYASFSGAEWFVENENAVIERSLTRLTPVENELAEGETEATYFCALGVNYFMGTSHARDTVSGKGSEKATQAQAFSTNLMVAGDAAAIHSIRIYLGDLSADARNQNHLADLCGFYQIDSETVKAILDMNEEDFGALLTKASIIAMKGAFGDTAEGSAYLAGKDELLAAVDAVLTPPVVEIPAYVDLYVKDGLVALFDAYSAKATDGATAIWTAVNLYGKTGYDAYIDPTTYIPTLSGSWTYDAKGAHNVGNGCLNLDALGALIGTEYSIQEVSSYLHLGSANIVDGVLQNKADLKAPHGTYFTSMAGGFHYGYLVTNLVSASSGNSKNFLQVIDEQIWWNTQPGKMTAYLTHTYLTGAEYNTQYYESLTDTAGGSYENILVGGPTAVERTIFRANPVAGEAVDGVTPYTSTYKMHIQLPMEVRDNAASTCDWSVTVSKTTAEADHKQTCLRVGNGGATMHSIRIYNKELNGAEFNQNHFADLVAYYDIGVEYLGAFTDAALATLGATLSTLTVDAAVGSDAYTANRNRIYGAVEELGNSYIQAAQDAVKFEGITYRVTGDYGVRSVFSINADAIKILTDAGYTVTYGAVLATKSETAIEVALDENGKVVLAEGVKGALTANDQDGFKYLTEDENAFGTAITFKADGSQADYYDTELAFTAFVVVSMNGELCTVAYDNVTLTSIEKISLLAVHQYAYDNTEDADLKARLEEVLPKN